MDNFLLSIENSKLFEYYILAILVKQKARNASLIQDIDKNILIDFIKWCNKNNLYINNLRDDLYLITRNKSPKITTDSDLGKILGFKCYNDTNWNNVDIPRKALHIIENTTSTDIYTEVCSYDYISDKELKKFAEEKIIKFNNAIKQEIKSDRYSFRYEIENIIPNNIYIKHIENDDMEYILENKDEYANLLYNYFYDGTIFEENPDYIIEKYPLAKFLLLISVRDGIFDDIYAKYEPYSDGFNNLLNEMKKLENKLLNANEVEYGYILNEFMEKF